MARGRKLTKEQASAMGKKGGPKHRGQQSATTVARLTAREELRKLIEKDQAALYSAWRESALGHFVQVKLPGGTTNVYKKSPNAIAIKDMFERAYGKPDQKVEANVTVESQADLVMAAVIEDLEKIIEKQHANDDGGDDHGVDDEDQGDTGEGASA